MKIVNGVKESLVSILRRVKIMMLVAVLFIAIGILSLAIFGGYVLFGQGKYTLAYVITSGEVVTVTKVLGDNITTAWWNGQSQPDPRIIVRKANGWERSFPASLTCANLKSGDKLVMTGAGQLRYLGEPLPIGQDVASNQVDPINLNTETLADELVPVKKAKPSKEKLLSSIPREVPYE